MNMAGCDDFGWWIRKNQLSDSCCK